MKKRMILSTAAASLLLAANAFAAITVIEGFENTADPGAWGDSSPDGQTHNHSPFTTPPTYVSTNVTEGVSAGQFTLNWVAESAAAPSNPYGTAAVWWGVRFNVGTPAAFPSIPNSNAVFMADIFNTSTTDTIQVAFCLRDTGGTGGLERTPFISCPPNQTTTYTFTPGTDAVSTFVTGNSVLDGSTSTFRGMFVYTETTPTVLPGSINIVVDNIRIDAQSDLTAPAAPVISSVKAGTNPGELVVNWVAGTEPDLAGYKVYLADDTHFGTPIPNRFGFPTTPAATVNSPSATSTTLTGVATGQNVYVYVSAFDNATPVSNESISDIVLGANLKADGSAPENEVVLDLDRYALTDGNIYTNGYYHAIAYWGQALTGQTAPVNYTSCRAAAVENGSVVLNPTGTTIWSTSRDGEATVDQTLTEANETKISDFLTAGGDLLIAGTSLGEDLVTNGSGADQTFYANVLRASLTNENSAVSTIDADATFPTVGAFATGTDVFNTAGGTNSDNEVVTAGSGAVGAFTYTGITPGNAAVLYDNKLVYLAFAFETVRNTGGTTYAPAQAARTALVTDALTYLAVDPGPPAADASNWSLYE